MIRKIKLETSECSFTFAINTEVFTNKLAKSLNEFFVDNEVRLDHFNNDFQAAALSLYASILFGIMVDQQPTLQGFAYFFNKNEYEGFIPMYDKDEEETHKGIELIAYDYTFCIPEAEDFYIAK